MSYTPNTGQARGSLSPHGTNNRDRAMSEARMGLQWVLTKQSAEHKDLLGKASCLAGQLQGWGCGGVSLSCCHFALPSRTETQRGTWQHELPAQPFQKAAAWRGPARAGNRTFIPCIHQTQLQFYRETQDISLDTCSSAQSPKATPTGWTSWNHAGNELGTYFLEDCSHMLSLRQVRSVAIQFMDCHYT